MPEKDQKNPKGASKSVASNETGQHSTGHIVTQASLPPPPVQLKSSGQKSEQMMTHDAFEPEADPHLFATNTSEPPDDSPPQDLASNEGGSTGTVQGKFTPIQRQESPLEEEETMQGKFAPVQRKEDLLDEEETMQGKFFSPVQRQESPLEEEETLQGKFAPVQRKKLGTEKSAPTQDRFNPIQQKSNSSPPIQRSADAGSNAGLSDAVLGKMESSLGADFSDVKIHSNSSKATDVGALAYTQGNDVHFAPGQFKQDSAAGQELIGHELTHVVQQREGRVKPTTEVNGVPVNDNEGLEKEADVLGKKAAQAKFDPQAQPASLSAPLTQGPIQQKPIQRTPDGDSIQDNIFSDNQGGVRFDQTDMEEQFMGSTFQGSDSFMLRQAMEALYGGPGMITRMIALRTIAHVRDMDYAKAQSDYAVALAKRAIGRAKYAIKCAESGVEYEDPSPNLDTETHSEFTASDGQLRFGKILGDVFGIDAVFGSLISPTGGLVGPGNSNALLTSLDPDNPVSIHGTVHDAAGYLYNCHDIGPGYDYIGDENVSEENRGNPLTGQSNINWWNDAYERQGRDVPWSARFLGRGSRGLTPFVEGKPQTDKGYEHMPEAEESLRQIAPQQMLYELAAHDVAYHLTKEDIPPAVETAFTENGYKGVEDGFIFRHGPLGFRSVTILPAEGSGKLPILAIRGTNPGTTREDFETIYTDLDEAAVGTQQFMQNKDRIEAIINAAGGRVDVTGHSLGGAVAQHVAVNFSNMVANVATFQSPGLDQDSIDRFNAIPEDERPNVVHHIVTGDVVDKAGDGNIAGTVYEHDFGLHLNLFQLIQDIQGHYTQVKGAADALLDVDFLSPSQNVRDYEDLKSKFGAFKTFLTTVAGNIGTAHGTRVFSAANYQDIREQHGIADEAFAGGQASAGNQSGTNAQLGEFDTHPHQDERELAEAVRSALGPELQRLFRLVWAALDKWEEIKQWAGGVRDSAVNTYNQARDAVVDRYNTTRDAVVEGATNLRDDVVDFGQQAGEAIQEGWTNFRDQASSAAQRLRDRLPF